MNMDMESMNVTDMDLRFHKTLESIFPLCMHLKAANGKISARESIQIISLERTSKSRSDDTLTG